MAFPYIQTLKTLEDQIREFQYQLKSSLTNRFQFVQGLPIPRTPGKPSMRLKNKQERKHIQYSSQSEYM